MSGLGETGVSGVPGMSPCVLPFLSAEGRSRTRNPAFRRLFLPRPAPLPPAMLALTALLAPLARPPVAPLNNASSSDALRARLEQRVQTLGRPDPPGMVDGTLGTSHQGATKARRNDGEAQVASASSKLRGAVAADVQRMLSDVERMGKTEDDEMTTLRTRVRVLERTVRERDDELRDARPRILALEAELASMRDETDGLRKANQKLKEHLGTVRRSLQTSLSPEALSDL